MDELELRLRTRLERLADAVPVTADARGGMHRVRVSRPVARTSGLAPMLVAAVVVIAVVAVGALVMGRPAGPAATTPLVGASATASPSPSPSATPATSRRVAPASATPVPAMLSVGIVEWDGCPKARLGPCRYQIVLTWDDGTSQKFRAPWDMTIEPGHYRIRVELRHGSDTTVADSCKTDFTALENSRIDVNATFGKGKGHCSITVDDARARPRPDATPTPPGTVISYPDACASYDLSPARCAYIVDWAIKEAGLAGQPAAIDLLGDPACDGVGPDCIVNRTTAFIVRVRITAPDGTTSDHSVSCGVGGEASLLCSEAPQIHVSTPIGAGYQDIPCGTSGELKDCASPVPSIEPEAAAQAVALRVPSVVVPIDHTGDYTVDLGDAVLPNGILSESSATLVNDRRTDVLIPAGIRLEVVGEDGKPLMNVYDHGWRPGTERVHARLVFTVESFDPGAVLDITDIVVR